MPPAAGMLAPHMADELQGDSMPPGCGDSFFDPLPSRCGGLDAV